MSRKYETYIKKELSQLSNDELMKFIQKLRSSRSRPKATSIPAKRARKKRASESIKLKDMIKGLSAEERQQLLNLIGG